MTNSEKVDKIVGIVSEDVWCQAETYIMSAICDLVRGSGAGMKISYTFYLTPPFTIIP